MATLYIVSTPIGNLGDVTHRAVETLSAVPRILAEDTRRTRILLRRYGIEGRPVSLHEHNEAARTGQALQWLAAGDDVALVSDAGTPLLSDPGERLVRAAILHGHEVIAVPGASALLAALVTSGIAPVPFTFFGFLPRSRAARGAALNSVATCQYTAVLYEAPGRLAALLAALRERCDGGRRVAVARELTKVHETVTRGTLEEMTAYYENERVRGEVVVVLAGMTATGTPEAAASEAAGHLASSLLEGGGKRSAVARELTRRLGLARAEAYRIALAADGERGRKVD